MRILQRRPVKLRGHVELVANALLPEAVELLVAELVDNVVRKDLALKLMGRAGVGVQWQRVDTFDQVELGERVAVWRGRTVRVQLACQVVERRDTLALCAQ